MRKTPHDAPGSLSSSSGTALPAPTPLQLTVRAIASTARRAVLPRCRRLHGRQRHGEAPLAGDMSDTNAAGRSERDREGEGTTTSASARRPATLLGSARAAQAEVLCPTPRGEASSRCDALQVAGTWTQQLTQLGLLLAELLSIAELKGSPLCSVRQETTHSHHEGHCMHMHVVKSTCLLKGVGHGLGSMLPCIHVTEAP